MLQKDLLEGLNAVVFMLLAIMQAVGFAGSSIPPALKYTIIALLVVFYFVLVLVKIIKNRNKHFIEGSDKFFKYFDSWYSKKGKLSIFCNDLDWTQKHPHDLITTLEIKAKEDCRIYLRNQNINSSIEERLKKSGIKILFVDDKVSTLHRFSIREDENMTYMIVGEKSAVPIGKEGKIEVKEENSKDNPYIINIAKDLLRKCEDASR